MSPFTDGPQVDRLTGARWLMTAVAAPAYDESAGGIIGLLALGLDWLKQAQLAALVWLRFRQATYLPADLALELRRVYYAASVDTNLLQRQELQAALQALAAQGLCPVLFKGAALAFTVYPDPAARRMGDLDLWVTADEMDTAQQALETLGYLYKAKPDRPPAIMEMFMGERQMYGVRPGTGLIELHFGVFAGEWLRRTARIDEREVRARIVATTIVQQAAFILAPEDALIQLAVHAAVNHQLSLSPLRSLLDVTFLARHAPPDWSVIVQRARAWRVATAMWLVLSLAVDLCGLNEAAEAAQQLAPSRVRQKLIGLFANGQSLVDLRDLSKSRWRYVYLLFMVDRKRDAAKLVYRALWPESDWLQARYGQAGWRTRLQHFLDAARGRI